MQAVILAGGLGTRLWPRTKQIPKPMIPVAGLPYLEHQLRFLRKQSITEILLLVGYLGDQIVNYFGDGSRLGLSIRYSREPMPLGTAGALREAQAHLAVTFLVLYGDSFLPVDYTSVLHLLEASPARGLLVAYDNRRGDTSVRNNTALDAEHYVVRYAKDQAQGIDLDYVEAGVLAFRRSVLDLIPPSGAASLENEIFPKLITSRELIAYVTCQRFYDIGTPERLKAIEELFTRDHHADAISH